MTLLDLFEDTLDDSSYLVEGLKIPKFPIILGATLFKDKVLKNKFQVDGTQKKVLKHIYSVYGDDVARAILIFKKKIVDPFMTIKDQLKDKRRISSKDITGLSKEEFLSSLESGRKKIEQRGSDYYDKIEDIQKVINKHKQRLDTLRAAKSEILRTDVSSDNPRKIDHNIIGRVFKEFDIEFADSDKSITGLEKEGPTSTEIDRFENLKYSDNEPDKRKYNVWLEKRSQTRHQFNLVFNRIMKEYEHLKRRAQKYHDDPDYAPADKDIKDVLTKTKRLRELWRGQNIDLIKNNRGSFYVDNKFRFNLAKYFFSREIIDKIRTVAGDIGPFKGTYLTILKEQEKRISDYRERKLQDLITLKKSIKFTPKEEKVWEKRRTAPDFSNKLEDYVQKVSEKDFLEKPIFVERTKEMKDAEGAIENETRKFIRKISQIVSEEDLEKLKDAKLITKSKGSVEINKFDNSMFRSDNEVKKEVEQDDKEKEDDKEDKEYLSQDQYHLKLRQIANISYDTVTALNRAKEEAEDLYDSMVKQGDKEAADEYKNLLNQIKLRKGLKPTSKIKGEGLRARGVLDVDNIQNFIEKMLKKAYKNSDDIRADQLKLNQLVKRFKDERGEEGEQDLADINFLFDQLSRKFTDYRYSSSS